MSRIETVIVTFSKEEEMARACSTHRAKRNAYRVLVGKAECNRPGGNLVVVGRIIRKYIVTFRPVVRQRGRNKQLDNGSY
jgi:hypothetical protein